MKRSFPGYCLLASILILGLLSACNNDKTAGTEDVTDIPFNTASPGARTSFTEGLALLDVGDFQQARSHFVQAVQQDPKFALAYLFKANTSLSPREFTEDLSNAKANLDSTNKWETLYYQYYNTFLNNNWDKRLEITQQIAKSYPNAARAQVDLGNTYAAGNQDAKARECFLKAVELDSEWTGGYAALANSYMFGNPKDFKKAEEAASKLVRLAPNSPAASITLGDSYRAQNDLEKAREAYSKAIELNPNSSVSYYKKGHADSYLGNYDEARKDFADAASHDDSKFGDIIFTGNTYLYAGDYKEALSYLRNEMAKMDTSGETDDRINIGKLNVLEACANIALHTDDAGTLKKLIPVMQPVYMEVANDIGTEEEKQVEKAAILYWQAIALALEGKYDEATTKTEEIKAALSSVNDPNKLSNYYFAKGYIAMKQENPPEAVAAFEKTNPTSMYNQYWLAKANEAAGNAAKANSIYQQIANYNFNEVGYALVRNEVKKKVSAL